ncbi:L-alanine-DL-glutamate epimerase [bacterium A37T11]|nr:L-alanine-DL-glutamate epimerase [bacterium A37T11]
MHILELKAYRKKLAIKRPYTIARNTFFDAEVVFLEVKLANGMVGFGSSATDVDVVGESAEDTINNLTSEIVQSLVGHDIREFNKIIQDIRLQFPKHPGTQAAIDLALHDAFGQWLGISVLDFYGRRHQKMLTSVTIGIKNVVDTLAEAQEYYDSGFKVLKVKTGIDPEEDAERIIKLREKYHDYFRIRVDANTGYDAAKLQLFLDQTAGQEVELVEQPFPPGMESDLMQFPEPVRRLLAADESLKNAKSALALAKDMPYGIFNIKLMKCGGIAGALEIANIAKQADISLFWGCNDESMVSITGALHVAFSCAHTQYIDLDGSFDLAEDVVKDGFTLEDGYLIPNERAGLGLILL